MNTSDGMRELDRFCKTLGWRGRDLAHGRNYQIKGKTTVSLYNMGVDKPGTVEVAFEVDGLAAFCGQPASKVREWIKFLQQTVGAYATPKTKYQYPRLALASTAEIAQFTQEASRFIKNEWDGSETKQVANTSTLSDDSRPDEHVWAQILSRRGQPQFRALLLEAYGTQCAVTGCDTVAALEAAHIIPHSEERAYAVERGILLRADVHTLFDLYLLSVDPETGLVVLAEECRPCYGEWEGAPLRLPEDESAWPSASALRTHYQKWLNRKGSS